MPDSGVRPSTTSTSAWRPALPDDLDDVLHQQLVVAVGEQFVGEAPRDRIGRHGVPGQRQQVGRVDALAVGDGLDERRVDPLAFEGTDEAHACGGEADPTAGGGDENRGRHG